MSVFLYEQRILALEKRFENVWRQMGRLQKGSFYATGKNYWKMAKIRLDAFRLQVRMLKDESAFYVKLGQFYDLIKFHNDLFDFILRRDPDLFDEILAEFNGNQSDLEE